MHVRDLSIIFPEKSDPLFRNVTFRLERGENAALVGPNGIGKSTLLKALVDQQPYEHGSIRWGTNVKIGYYDQEHTGLNHANTVLEELWSSYPHIEEARIRTVLGNFLFSGDDVKKKISTLSGGERARVSLSKLMLAHANMLILDEPTNHLDLYSKEVLEGALMDYDGTLLFISHDRYFLNKMADYILELSPDGIRTYLGNYDNYVEKKAELAELYELASAEGQETAAMSASTSAEQQLRNKPRTIDPLQASRRLLGTLQREPMKKRSRRGVKNEPDNAILEQIEAQITAKEEAIADIEAQLIDPDNLHDYVKLQELHEQLEHEREELEQLYEEWGRLME